MPGTFHILLILTKLCVIGIRYLLGMRKAGLGESPPKTSGPISSRLWIQTHICLTAKHLLFPPCQAASQAV